ncbi:unnamed protein product, partial [Linum tenue]
MKPTKEGGLLLSPHFTLSTISLHFISLSTLSTLSINRQLTCSSELDPGGNPGSFAGSLPPDEIG